MVHRTTKGACDTGTGHVALHRRCAVLSDQSWVDDVFTPSILHAADTTRQGLLRETCRPVINGTHKFSADIRCSHLKQMNGPVGQRQGEDMRPRLGVPGRRQGTRNRLSELETVQGFCVIHPVAATHNSTRRWPQFALLPRGFGVHAEGKQPYATLFHHCKTLVPRTVLGLSVHCFEMSLVFENTFFCPRRSHKLQSLVFQEWRNAGKFFVARNRHAFLANNGLAKSIGKPNGLLIVACREMRAERIHRHGRAGFAVRVSAPSARASGTPY